MRRRTRLEDHTNHVHISPFAAMEQIEDRRRRQRRAWWMTLIHVSAILLTAVVAFLTLTWIF